MVLDLDSQKSFIHEKKDCKTANRIGTIREPHSIVGVKITCRAVAAKYMYENINGRKCLF